MHYSDYLLSLPSFQGKTANSVLSCALSAAEASYLKQLAVCDSLDVWYSGMISLAQGLGGITGRRYSWSTVKLYYSSFYFMKSILLANGWCQFYIQGKPRIVNASPGAMPEKQDGNSHDSCYRSFGRIFPSSSLITQPIGIDSAANWMKRNREEVNYNLPRFTDPMPPVWFEEHANSGVRRGLSEYLSDPYAYAFIDRHAMVAYPLAAAIEAAAALRLLGVVPSKEDSLAFASYWKDSNGRLPGSERFFC